MSSFRSRSIIVAISLWASSASADVLFLNLNNSSEEAARVRSEAAGRGEKVIEVTPFSSDPQLAQMMTELARLKTKAGQATGDAASELKSQVDKQIAEIRSRTRSSDVDLNTKIQAVIAGKTLSGLVVSGHSDGNRTFYNDVGTQFSLDDLSRFSPQLRGANPVVLMGCFTGTNNFFDKIHGIIPDSPIYGYGGKAPLRTSPDASAALAKTLGDPGNGEPGAGLGSGAVGTVERALKRANALGSQAYDPSCGCIRKGGGNGASSEAGPGDGSGSGSEGECEKAKTSEYRGVGYSQAAESLRSNLFSGVSSNVPEPKRLLALYKMARSCESPSEDLGDRLLRLRYLSNVQQNFKNQYLAEMKTMQLSLESLARKNPALWEPLLKKMPKFDGTSTLPEIQAFEKMFHEKLAGVERSDADTRNLESFSAKLKDLARLDPKRIPSTWTEYGIVSPRGERPSNEPIDGPSILKPEDPEAKGLFFPTENGRGLELPELKKTARVAAVPASVSASASVEPVGPAPQAPAAPRYQGYQAPAPDLKPELTKEEEPPVSTSSGEKKEIPCPDRYLKDPSLLESDIDSMRSRIKRLSDEYHRTGDSGIARRGKDMQGDLSRLMEVIRPNCQIEFSKRGISTGPWYKKIIN